MFIFYFLGVGPPCCSILCQFWLCEEAQCVYLRRHLGSPGTAFKLCIVTVSFETVKGSYQYELMDSYFIQQVIIHYYYYIFYIPIVLISWWFLFKLIFVSFSHVPNFFDIFLAFWLRYFSLHL